MYEILKAKARKMNSELLMEFLNQPKIKKHIEDWRNWTEPVSLGIAIEANKRGLI